MVGKEDMSLTLDHIGGSRTNAGTQGFLVFDSYGGIDVGFRSERTIKGARHLVRSSDFPQHCGSKMAAPRIQIVAICFEFNS
jgi:hypothetical protein